MDIDFRTLPVKDLLPHDLDMVLLDKIIDYSEESVTASVCVKQDCIYYESSIKGVSSILGLEWMAQAVAAVAGIHALKKNQAVQIGFLLGSRNYAPSTSVFTLGQEYIVHVDKLYQEDNGLGAFEGVIRHAEHVIVTSKLNVFAPHNVEEFLQ